MLSTRHAIRRSGDRPATFPVRVNRTRREEPPTQTALAFRVQVSNLHSTRRPRLPVAALRSGPLSGCSASVPTPGETVNPVRLVTLHPVLENPPAAAAEALAHRRPVDVRRVLFAAASRPSSGWGA